MKKNIIVKHVSIFLITSLIFALGFFLSSTINGKRIREIESLQQQIAVDILSSETQFNLLQQVSCDQQGGNVLSSEIALLGERLSFMESQLGSENSEVQQLKTYYSLLLIKDYLLAVELQERCGLSSDNILVYFYTSECEDCRRQGFVLDRLHSKYPELRVYAFDASLGVGSIETFQNIVGSQGLYPLIAYNKTRLEGFYSFDELEALLPIEMTMPPVTEGDVLSEENELNEKGDSALDAKDEILLNE